MTSYDLAINALGLGAKAKLTDGEKAHAQFVAHAIDSLVKNRTSELREHLTIVTDCLALIVNGGDIEVDDVQCAIEEARKVLKG